MNNSPSTQIYPLASARGKKFLCELCKENATIICPKCRVTYYCSKNHQITDWESIHSRICQLLIPVRTVDESEVPYMGPYKEYMFKKGIQRDRLRDLLMTTSTVAQRLLYEKKPLRALPAAMQALHTSVLLHGSESIEHVPSYLILAETKLGLGMVEDAESYAAQADWIIIRAGTCPNSVRSNLYRTMGMIYFAKGEYLNVRLSVAQDIYYASKEYGPLDYHVTGGYYMLAKTFDAEGRKEVAESLFVKTTEIWRKCLSKLTKSRIEGLPAVIFDPYREVQKSIEQEEKDNCLDEAEQAQALVMLHHILTRMTSPKAAHCLAMLYFLQDKTDKAREYGQVALLEYRPDPEAINEEYLIEAHENMREYRNRAQSAKSAD